MTFDHRLKEGRERARWLTEKEHSGKRQYGVEELWGRGAFIIWTAGARQLVPGGGDGESEGDEVKGPGGSPVRLGGMSLA